MDHTIVDSLANGVYLLIILSVAIAGGLAFLLVTAQIIYMVSN